MQPNYAPPMPQYPPQQPYASPAPPQGYAQYGSPYGVAPGTPHAPAVYGGPQQPQAQPLPAGSLDSFYQQPSASGGPSFKFKDKPIGTWYEGVVARAVTDTDVRAQTDNNGNVQTYRDGRPKFVMVVPMLVAVSPEFPEGTAGWWVKGQARDELARAMAEAGAPAGAPEAGAWIRVTLVGTRQIPGGFSPAYQYRVEYQRPQGAGQPAPVPAQPPQAQPAPVQQVPVQAGAIQQGPMQTPAQPVPAQEPQVQQVPAQEPQVQQVQTQVPAQQPMTAAPTGLTPGQQELLAKLLGQQAA